MLEMNIMKTRIIVIAILLVVFTATAFAQDDDITTAKVVNTNRQEIGKAEIITASNDFGFYVKMWLNGGKLRIIKPNSGSRNTMLNCSFREYKVNPNNPKDQDGWEEIGSGIATLQTPVDSNGNVSKMTGSMTLTEKVVNDKEIKVSENAQKFEIILD